MNQNLTVRPAPEPESSAPVVLIVDDNPENLTVLGDLLQPDHRVRAASHGARALALATLEPRPELILLDVMMPGMDGYEVLRRLRAAPRTRDIPVIFVTAMDGDGDEVRGLEHGAVDYITKPLQPDVVRARVRTQLQLKRARDRLHRRNTRLRSEVARRTGETALVEDVSILALTRLAGMRDVETGCHLRRTQEYVRVLAEALSGHPKHRAALNPRTIDLMAKSAPLHDIGKVGIPDRILLKRGKLTADEWAVMKTHARLGAESIEQAERDAHHALPFLACAKQIAQHHHERWDGSGYPGGLAGDDIPLAARLMALADVFDALVSRRVYKEAMGQEAARAAIVAERGRHFDPDVVDAFVANFDRFVDIFTRFADPSSPGKAPDATVAQPQATA